MHNGSLLRTRPLLAMGTAASCTRQWAMLTYLVWFTEVFFWIQNQGAEFQGLEIRVHVCTSNIVRSTLRDPRGTHRVSCGVHCWAESGIERNKAELVLINGVRAGRADSALWVDVHVPCRVGGWSRPSYEGK